MRDGGHLDENQARGSLTYRSRRLRAVVMSAAGGLCAATASAQTPATEAPAKFAVIEGIAVDSLHRDYLRGAVLLLEGANAIAMTDSMGRFRFDSVAPGSHRIYVSHPILDTVGVSLITPPLQIVAGEHRTLVLGTPTPQTLLAIKCSPAERAAGPDALLGLVQYAETKEPASGSEVTVVWTDYDVTSKHLRGTPRRRVATVSESGLFHLCGLPAELSATVTAAIRRDTTSAVAVEVNSVIGVIGLELPEPEVAASGPSSAAAGAITGAPARSGRAVLTGRVVGPDGRPLDHARVSVGADSTIALSGADGRFELRNLRAGTRSVSVRRLGFEPAEVVVNLRVRDPSDIVVRLGAFVPELDTVRITATLTRQGLDRVGFTRRTHTAAGYYMTPEDIRRRSAFELADLLTMAPMLRRTYSGMHAKITGRPHGLGGGCVTYVVDGFQWREGVEDFIMPAEVGAIEVYSSGFIPPEFVERAAVRDGRYLDENEARGAVIFSPPVLRAAMLCIACGFSAAAASAQTPVSGGPAKFAVIEGIAVDSLHHNALRGAIILVEGANATTMTDSSGRFRLDSVPPGARRISVVHPILDTVGVSLMTAPLQIVPGQHLDLVIGTPSPQTLVALEVHASRARHRTRCGAWSGAIR